MMDWEKYSTRMAAFKGGMFEGFIIGACVGGAAVAGLCAYWY